jgi:hypothetical protein
MDKRTMIVSIVGIICTTALVVGITSPDETTSQSKPVEKTKTIVVQKTAKAVQPDGYMSEVDCAKLATGTAVSDLVWKFGWPASDYAYSGFSETFFYPIHDRGDDRCVVDVDDNKVVSTLYRDE